DGRVSAAGQNLQIVGDAVLAAGDPAAAMHPYDSRQGPARAFGAVDVECLVRPFAIGEIAPGDDVARDVFLKSGLRRPVALGEGVLDDRHRGPWTEPEGQYHDDGEHDRDTEKPEEETFHIRRPAADPVRSIHDMA